jgi:hypothetical protein
MTSDDSSRLVLAVKGVKGNRQEQPLPYAAQTWTAPHWYLDVIHALVAIIGRGKE